MGRGGKAIASRLSLTRTWAPGEKLAVKVGSGRDIPPMIVRKAVTMGLPIILGEDKARGRWREWKSAFPVPRGMRQIVGATKVL